MSETKLLPCPNLWCKPDNRRALYEHSTSGKKKIHCECGIGAPYCDTREEAIAAWNARTPDPRIAAAQGMYEALKYAADYIEGGLIIRKRVKSALEAWEKAQ